MPCRSTTRCSRGEEREAVRELLILTIVLTLVAVAIYVSFA